MNRVCIIILFFFYIYPVSFTGFPISSRLILSLFSFYFIFLNIVNKRIFFSIEILKISLCLSLIFVLSISTNLFNLSYDFAFIKYPLSVFAIFLASYSMLCFFQILELDRNFKTISDIFIQVVCLQSIISILMFISPAFFDFIMSIQNLSNSELELISSYDGFRLIGFGSMFFGAGIIHGLALIIISYKFRCGEYDQNILKFFIIYMFLVLIGIGMARTTFVGFGFSLLLILMPKNCLFTINYRSFSRNFNFLLYFFMIPLLSIFTLYIFFNDFISKVIPLFDFVFEMFINYYNTGSMTTDSTSHLSSMYIYPQNIITYFIGDGLFTNADGSYYMHTDVGYLRLVYYFGVGGVLLFLLFQYELLRVSLLGIRFSRVLCYFIFAYILTLNLKGFTDLVSVLSVFYLATVLAKKGKCNDC